MTCKISLQIPRLFMSNCVTKPVKPLSVKVFCYKV